MREAKVRYNLTRFAQSLLCRVNETSRSRLIYSLAESVVKRPGSLSTKTKKPSKLRMSIGAHTDDDTDTVVTPRKPLGRQAIERNAEQFLEDERPRYSKEGLKELKQSTPSTPKDLSANASSAEEEAAVGTLDVASKFGATSLTNRQSVIPSATEIAEKKQRRARLAQEREFISLNHSDSEEESRELLLRPKEKYAETRLVREDEDLAEGFDEYVEDGRVALGRKAEREERQRKRREIESLIADAEGGGDEGDGSEEERNEAYEAAQTRKGTYGTTYMSHQEERDRPRTPPKITPIPDLASVVGRMRDSLQEMREVKAAKGMRKKELEQEKKEIAEREVWIQNQLKEVGERYEKLRVEAGMTGEAVAQNGVVAERGLESFGNTPRAGTPMALGDE